MRAAATTDPAPVSSPRHESPRAALFLLHAAFVLTGVVTTLLGPFVPLLASRWYLDDWQAGLLFTLQFAGSLVGVTVSSAGMTRAGFRSTIVIGLLLMAAGVMPLALDAAAAGFAGVFCYGIGLGLTIPTMNLTVADWQPSRRAAALNVLNLAWGVGAVGAPPVVAYFHRSGQAQIFPVALAAALALIALTLSRIRLPRAREAGPAEAGPYKSGHMERSAREAGPTEAGLYKSGHMERSAREAGPTEAGLYKSGRLERSPAGEAGTSNDEPRWWTPDVLLFGALLFVYVGTETALAGWIAVYASRLAVVAPAVALAAPSIFWAALLLGRAGAPLALRWMPEAHLVVASLIAATAGVALLLAAGSARALVLAVSLGGLGLATVFPTTVALFSRTFDRASARLAAPVFALASLGGASLPTLVGVLSTWFDSLTIGLIVPLLGCLSMLIVYRNIRFRIGE